jgi:phosphoglycerate kinase
MFTKKTVRDIDLKGKKVLLRADYNVPVKDAKISDDFRVQQSLPTIRYLLQQGASVIICSHLGRPDGRLSAEFSLFPVAKRLDDLLPETTVTFVSECIGEKAEAAANRLQPGEVLLLENLRFHPEEEANDENFAKALASLADVFVQDGFGVVHRAHASTDALARLLPSVAGLLLEREVNTITNVMEAPKRPLMAIVGGAKISDKIEILHRFVEIADYVAIGGAMANTFLAAEGIDVAISLVDHDEIPLARDILEKAHAKAKQGSFVFYLPQDGVVANKIDRTVKTRIVDWSAHIVSSIENYPKQPPIEASQVQPDEMILDIGPFSASFIAGGVQFASTVVWNGTMGVTETPALRGPVGPFAHGSEVIVRALLGEYGHKPFTLVGGGDTVAYIQSQKLVDAFGHVSTGGGASLELMAGRLLPGVEALENRQPESATIAT